MSFNQNVQNIGYKPGFFLATDECVRVTATISNSHSQVVTKADGSKYVPAGAVVPSNDAYAKGILYEDVDVSTGPMPGSIVTDGVVYEDLLPAAIESAAESALTGIRVILNAPTIKRPTSFNKTELASITVASTAGTGAGKTDIAVSGYTLGTGESYVYKIAETTAPAVKLGEVLPTSGTGAWTAATFPIDELAATSGHKITVAAVDSTGAAVAAGNATIAVGA